MTPTVYTNRRFSLSPDRLVEDEQIAIAGTGTLATATGVRLNTTVASGYPRIASDCPMLDAMYGIAIRDHQRLVIDQRM